MALDAGRPVAHREPVDEALLEAVERALDGEPKKRLAEMLGLTPAQATRIFQGSRPLQLVDVIKIEKALKLRRGTLLLEAGFVSPIDGSVRDALACDPLLTPFYRDELLAAYDRGIERSASKRSTRRPSR